MGSGTRIAFTDAQREEIARLYAENLPIRAIARSLGLSTGPVRRVLVEEGILIRPAQGYARPRPAVYLGVRVSEDYRDGFANGWRAALAAVVLGADRVCWDRAWDHWLRALVPWTKPEFEDTTPPVYQEE